MIKYIIIILFVNISFCHDVSDDYIKWKNYFRIGIIQSHSFDYGLGTYCRLKRNTKYTFKDLRLFLHILSNNNTYMRLRYKDSNKLLQLNRFYKFSSVNHSILLLFKICR